MCTPPKVVIDASLIVFKFLATSLHPADGIHFISSALTKHNIDVLIIMDPPKRHHSKQAHHQRVGKKERATLQLMLHHIELASCEIKSENATRISSEIQKLEKSDSRLLLPTDFVLRLEQLVATHKGQGKGEISVEMHHFMLIQVSPMWP